MGVKHYILRVEFQWRTSEHFHMVLHVVNGISLDEIHKAFDSAKFTVVKSFDFSHLPAEERKKREAEELESQRLAAQKKVEEFSTLTLGLTALHPEPKPDNWPPKEGINAAPPATAFADS